MHRRIQHTHDGDRKFNGMCKEQVSLHISRHPDYEGNTKEGRMERNSREIAQEIYSWQRKILLMGASHVVECGLIHHSYIHVVNV